MRSYLVYGVGFAVVFIPFLIFVAAGWPGAENDCLKDGPDGCFCEWVDVEAVRAHDGGVRQPANTWSNLYALITSFIVAFGISRDRKALSPGCPAPNIIKSDSWIADMYVFAVMFLGLGSMWFHASITQWGGRFDGASMYFFAGFMVWYTVHRLYPNALLFWLGYLATIIVFTAMHNWAPSELLIGILVGFYLLFEILILAKKKAHFDGWGWALLWWILALFSFGAALLFWVGGQAGNFLCDSVEATRSAFQSHALWHVFAGIMAVFLYYYWRREKQPSV